MTIIWFFLYLFFLSGLAQEALHLIPGHNDEASAPLTLSHEQAGPFLRDRQPHQKTSARNSTPPTISSTTQRH